MEYLFIGITLIPSRFLSMDQIYLFIYIYIYRNRERGEKGRCKEREREREERERERGGERGEREGGYDG